MKKKILIMKSALVALFVLFNAASYAQTMMPLPNHSRVYNGLARGYWFTAPTNFTITGLRVATNAGSGNQFIHVMKLNTTPPVPTSGSTNFNTLAYISNATNGVVQTVNIQVNAGDVIGILGTATTANSYGSGSHSTTINGQAVTLTRFGYQGTITGGAAPNYWGLAAGASGNIGRVEMYYTVGPPCGGIGTSNITAVNVNSVSAEFSWVPPTNTTEYEYAVTTSTADPTSGAVSTTVNSATISGLTPSTNYYFHIRNKCTAGNWSQWENIPFITLPPCSTPSGFNALKIEPGVADVRWNAVQTAIRYEYVLDNDRSTPAPGANAVSTINTSASFTGLTSGKDYYLHIRSICDSKDSSAWSLDSFYIPHMCVKPKISISNVNTSMGVASWPVILTAVGYEYAITKSSALPSSGTVIYKNSVLAPYLEDGTSYYIHVRGLCADRTYNSNSDWATTELKTHRVSVASLDDADNLLMVYPNPTSDILTVELKENPKKALNISIFDITGRVLIQQKMTSKTTKLDFSNLTRGVYILKYSDGALEKSVKVNKL